MLNFYFVARGRALVFFFFFFLSGSYLAKINGQTPCNCTNCPQFMQDNFVGSFLINVMNAANPTLGQGGQGVCGVVLNFDHEYLGDLSITLTSPAGQTVTLVGPIGLFGMTDGSAWNVTFLPCADPVSPDPGFANTWSNNQAWGLGGNYTGSYHPAIGCLENFNTGPVNGTWTLTVTDGQASDVGNFYDYEIIFCDPSGIDCFSCAANAGNLLQPDVTACEGASLLNLDLPPTYTAQSPAPPPSEYSYTYVIAGAGGVILDYDPGADLSSYSPGTYTVCGMSYLTVQEPSIPAPNGTLTVNQLRTILNSGTAPFCGKVSVNCVNVTINSAPPDEEEFEEVCSPACFLFHGTSYCQTGTYTITLTQNSCQYSATLHLLVHQPTTAVVTEQICEGSCSVNPNFPGACMGGSYTEKITNAAGCDSTITLNLTVLTVNAVISNNPVVPCGGGFVQLQGTGSSIGGYTYQWTASNGGNILGPANQINANVNAAGDYQLKVCRTSIGISCCDSAEVSISAAVNPPNPPLAVNGANSLCAGQTLNFNTIPVVGATSYTWTAPAGVTINSGASSVLTNVTWGANTGGQICVSANNGCGPSDTTCLTVNVNTPPVILAIAGPDTVCGNITATYAIPAVSNATTYGWTVSSPAQIVAGQGTTSITVNWNGATSGTICVGAANTCGPSPQQCKNITVINIPGTPVISGSAVSCSGTTGTYSVVPVLGATSYIWTVTGGTVTGGNGTASAQITWDINATTGSVCVRANNSCANSPQTCFNVTLGAPPPQPVIVGPAIVCAGDTVVYAIVSVPGATGYTWSVPPGGTLLNGQNTTSITVLWFTAPGGNIGVSADGSCGTAPQVNFPVVVNAVLVANAGTGQVLCGQTANLSGTVTGGQWSVVTGTGSASFVNANAAATPVTVGMTGLYTFRYTLNNAGCVSSNDVDITFNSIPAAGANSYLCDGANEYYTVSFPITGGTAPYMITGGTVANGIFVSDSILSGQPYVFNIIDANGCPSTDILGTHNCNCATNAGSVSQMALSACVNETVAAVQLTLPTFDANDVGAFVLHEGAGLILVNPIAQNTTGIFGFIPGMNFGQTYYISFVAGNNLNGLPNPLDPCFSVSQGQPVVFHDFPVALAGADIADCGNTVTLAASGNGQWSVLTGPAGESIQFGNNTAANSTATASASGSYTLSWTVTENGCTSTDQVVTTFNSNPVVANITRDCDAANQFFTVTIQIQGAGGYSVNGTPISGSIFTGLPLANNQTYTYTITDVNGCKTPDVTGAYACNCSTNAGTMGLTVLKACENATIQAVANNDANLDGNDVVAFVLHDGSGVNLGNIWGQNSTGLFSLLPGMTAGQTYYISRVAGNPIVASGFPNPSDPCFAVAQGQPVVFLKIPTPDAGPDNADCGNSLTLSAVPTSFAGQWSLFTGPGTAAFTQGQLAATPVNVSLPGVYTFGWTETNDICTGSDIMTATFNPLPAASVSNEICNNTNTQYSVVVDVTGGTAPFTIAGIGGSFAGNTFTSVLIPTNTTYSLAITDTNGCTFGPVEGTKNCNCLTDAGTMSIAPLVFCADQPAIAVWDNNAQLDGDDIVQFVLHTGSGGALGQVLGTSVTPQFNFGNGLITGQTYYVSAIAGNAIAGSVDINDACFSVASGTPVQWKAMPTGSISGTATICSGGQVTISFTGTGTYPLSFIWNDGNTPDQTILLTTGSTISVPVNPALTSTFTLTQIVDGTLPACSVDLQSTAVITVNQPVDAGTAPLELDICAEEQAIVTLSDLLVGADTGGTWLEVSSSPALPGTFDAVNGTFIATGQQPGAYKFRYKMGALAPCPDDETVIVVNIRPQPKSEAGADQTIDCDTNSVLLGGIGTTAGSGISYFWQKDGIAIPDAVQNTITVTEGGVYLLTVKNAFGCTASDEAIVSLDNAQPAFGNIVKKDVSCFGLVNGYIEVDTALGGTEPYLFSFNGGAFNSKRKFGPLASGVYRLEVMDANGCITQSDDITVEDPPRLTVDMGTDLNIKLGDMVSVEAILNVPFSSLDTIIWQPLFDSSGVGTVFQAFQPIRTASIDIFVKDTAGCSAIDRLLIFVDSRRHVYVPNIFDPAGSGINVVTVYGGGEVAQIESFKIFDRWGELMHDETGFQPNDETKGWNGVFQNKRALPGVYVWTAVILFKDGQKELFSGDVMIIR
jgi:hypothetical protein